jgi:hypothetical protein
LRFEGVLADNAAGLYPGDKIYNDASVEDIESLPITQIHRPVDLAVVAADQEGNVTHSSLSTSLLMLGLHTGYVKTYIILPSTIYGIVSNPLVDAGVQNPHSIQVPQLIRASIDRGQGGIVGLGKNIWPNVENGEVADLYIVLFDRIRANPEGTPHGREGFFFGANGEHTLYDVGKKIAEALLELGVGQSPEPTSFTEEEVERYFQVRGQYLPSPDLKLRCCHIRDHTLVPTRDVVQIGLVLSVGCPRKQLPISSLVSAPRQKLCSSVTRAKDTFHETTEGRASRIQPRCIRKWHV